MLKVPAVSTCYGNLLQVFTVAYTGVQYCLDLYGREDATRISMSTPTEAFTMMKRIDHPLLVPWPCAAARTGGLTLPIVLSVLPTNYSNTGWMGAAINPLLPPGSHPALILNINTNTLAQYQHETKPPCALNCASSRSKGRSGWGPRRLQGAEGRHCLWESHRKWRGRSKSSREE